MAAQVECDRYGCHARRTRERETDRYRLEIDVDADVDAAAGRELGSSDPLTQIES